MSKKKRKRIIIFTITFLFMSSIYFMVKTFSKYNSNVIASGDIGIAKWEILTNSISDSNIKVYTNGESVDYTLRITNNSEVASLYSIYISNLPDGIEIAIDSSEYKVPINGIVSFIDMGSFNPVDINTMRDHTIHFRATDNADEIQDIDIYVDLKFIQAEINN